MTLTSIGSYTVTRELPGDGNAYLVRSPAGERCHLWLLPGEVSESAIEDVRQQMAACGRMKHAALVGATDIFTTETQLAVTMLAVTMGAADGADGGQLLALISRGSMTLEPEAVWYIGHQLAGALAMAHAGDDDDFLAISHGFVSPSRVRIGWDGSVRLEGFGLATLVTEGVLQGDEGYVAPEQQDGSRVTPRGDIYALVALLLALLDGKAPAPGADLDQRIPQILHEPFGRALQASLGKRQVTAMELEQWLAQAAAPRGRSALANAVAELRKNSSRLGSSKPSVAPIDMRAGRPGSTPPKHASRSAIPRVAKPGGLHATFGAKRRVPPLRSKQSTLLGGPRTSEGTETPGRQSATPYNMDWEQLRGGQGERPAAPATAAGIADELSWGGEDAPTAILDREGLLAAARHAPRVAAAPPTTADADDEEDDDDEGADEATVMFSRDDFGEDVLAQLDAGGPPRRAAQDPQEVTLPIDEGEDEDEIRAGDEEGLVTTLDDDTTLFKADALSQFVKAKQAAAAKPQPLARVTTEDSVDPLAATETVDAKTAATVTATVTAAATARDRGAPLDEPTAEMAQSERTPPPLSGSGQGALTAQDANDDEDDEDAVLDEDDEGPTAASIRRPSAADVSDEAAPASADGATTLDAEDPDSDDGASEPAETAEPASDSDDQAPADSSDPSAAEPPGASDDIPVTTAHVDDDSAEPPDAPSAGPSPWASGDAEADDKPLSLTTMILVVIVSAAAVFFAGMAWVRSNATVGPPPLPTSAAGGTNTAPSSKPSAKPSTPPTAPSSRASATASAAAPAPAVDGISDDPQAAALPASDGLLRIVFTGDGNDAQVFVRGKTMGPVGSKIQLPCARPAFVTVGKPGPVWLSKGTTIKIACQKLTQATVGAK